MKSKSVSLFKSKAFKFGLLIIFAAAAILIGVSMMMGNEAGQFVIRVQSGNVDKSISITTDLEDTTQYTSKLSADGISNMTDYSPEHFLESDYKTLQELTEKTGVTDYEHGSLYIYTFYIKNTSSSGGVGVRATLSYSHVTNYLDEVARVLTYTTGYGVDLPYIYQKADDLPKIQEKFPNISRIEYPNYILQPTTFKSDSIVFDDQTFNIGYGEDQDYVKYSVLFWIEGNDPDSDYYAEALYNGTIRFQLDLTVEM